ncbi:uncharacterized protein A4U43_C05F940 [Asparagus officinalis]|uniref:Glucan endo-1,3-beta-D-glucosidase n=1 Tax=Asparagus officinalis TaxID=4686 RepID=A0A5P1EP15_ASPOF|nr:uncharacterized protein A4U43_C05F940 [Asparagus officinalis]
MLNTGGSSVGVNYGLLGDNLPPPDQVVSLLKSRNINKIRLFEPNPNVLEALHNSGIEVIIGTLNSDLPRLASDPSFATQWVQTNVLPHANSVTFRCITAANEVIPGDLAVHVVPAMKNLDAAVSALNLKIPVSTSVSLGVLGVSYPPSQGAFSEALASIMKPMISFLASKNTPFLVNIYPYYAYKGDKSLPLDYALFKERNIFVQDGSLGYTNMFDAIVDSIYSSLEKMGGSNVEVIVSETGWPSGGNERGATIDNAMAYNNNLVKHVNGNAGTPKRPGKGTETYLFALFNENLKKPGIEQNFGLYHPDMSEVYHVDF